MKIKKLTSVILAAMMTATAVPFNEVTVPYSNFTSYAVEAESEESYEQEIVAEGTCGENLTWSLNSKGTFTIEGEGAMDNWASPADVPWAEYTEQIKRISASDKLKNIGDYAFYGCVNIEMAFFSTIIGEHAYENCKNISGYTYYEDNTPAEIKDYAFYGCDNFSRITIDNSFCVIADSEFVFPDDFKIKCYENSPAHDYAVKYGKEVDLIVYSIASGVCGQNLTWSFDSDNCLRVSGTGKMTNWKSSDEVPWAEYADQIQEIVLQVYDIENIGDYAFSNLKNLTYIPIFGIIGAHAFEGCTNIQGYIGYDNLPVIAVKEDAFKGCNNSLLLFGNPDCYIADTETTIAEGAKIKCFEDSTAHKYALKYGREFELITNKEPVYPEKPYVPEESETPDDNNSSENGEQEIVAEGTCGENLTWELDDNGSLLISGEGDMDNWASAEDRPWAEYTSMIRTVSMPEEVTSIGDYAFYGCENLTSSALTSVIGAHAYEGCKRMIGYSYYGDSSPINEIKDCAFKGCYTLWAIPISNPDCIIADSEDVFDNNTTIMGYADSTAQKYAEKYERDFQDITLYKSEGSCGESLYWYMTSDGMLGISGSGEMQDYSEDITAAPWYKFAEDITSICINDFNSDDDAIALSENCFAMCENAEKIYFHNSEHIIADSAETIPENAVIWGYAGSTAQEYAEKYNREFEIIPTTDASGELNDEYTWELSSEGILYITGFDAMDDYTDVNPWGEYADKITSVYFYGNVTSIGKNAFSYCENLEFVDIDESIEFIDEDAFSGCDKLEFMNFHGNKKCVIYDSASTIPKQTELIGHFGSPVHEYADNYERSFSWIDGDINVDNSVDAGDASMVLAEYANIQTGGEAELSSVETTTADVTNDNVVDAADASAILQYYAKVLTGQNPTWD